MSTMAMGISGWNTSFQSILGTSLLLLLTAITAPTLTNALATQHPPLPKLKAAVIVPGFLTGASDFEALVQALDKRGIPSVTVPFPNWHWIPCLGGRSMRPMLERIDHTVRHLSTSGDVTQIPNFDYSILDCIQDFQDNPGGVLKAGGSSKVDEYDPTITPRGKFSRPAQDSNYRIALIGHSAGGWISRAYLSDRNYGGRAYKGSQLVHSLVTLGSPHGNAPGAAFEGVEWVNREQVPENVNALAVAGSGFRGDSSGQLTKNAYSFCCPNGSDGSSYNGDGLTPVFSALAMEGAEQMVLDGTVTHFPWSDVFGGEMFAPDLAKRHREEGIPWYGDEEALDQWASWLETASS